MRRFALFVFTLILASPAHAEWWQARTDHFIVYSESSQGDARKFAETLERFDQAMRTLQNIEQTPARSDAQRLTVYRFGEIDDIGRLAGSQGVAGFYIPQVGGSVAFTPARSTRRSSSIIRRDSRTELDPMSVLLHEYSHHFMFQHFSAAYPSWYREGFAETAATIDLKDDGSFHVGNPPQYRSDTLFSTGLNVSASDMLTSTDRPDYIDVIGHYTVGWLLNHYLTFSGERQGQLTQYLRLINSGDNSATAARKAFGDLRKLDSDMLRYRNSRRLGGANVRPANYSPPQVEMRRLGEDEEAIMSAKMRSKRGVTRKKAGDIASDARSVAQRFPNSYAVNLELAEAELDARNYVAAEQAADRALAARPDSVDAMILKGQTFLERGKKEKQYLPTARTWFAKAYEADPRQPASLYHNYMSYYYDGTQMPESALLGLERAFSLAPYATGLRFVLARQLLAEKKGLLARDILQPVALNAHESKSGKIMSEVIELIEKKQTEEAYKKLAGEMKKWEDEAEKD